MKKITIGILTYNHEKFIVKCLNSVLELKYENLEIVISDDCSIDNTFQIVQEIVAQSQSPHQIVLNRNEVNLGLAQNFNRTFYDLATGDLLITLGGDDAVKENYLNEALVYFSKDEEVMMVDFNADLIDENDILKGSAATLDFDQKKTDVKDYLGLRSIPSFAPGRMLRKSLISSFNPISKQCPTEDSVLVMRALLLGKHCRVNKKVILYRRHSSNLSSSESLLNMSNERIIAQYLNDVLSLYEKGNIHDSIVPQLIHRISLEHKKRIIFYSAGNQYLKIFKWNIFKLLYRVRLF